MAAGSTSSAITVEDRTPFTCDKQSVRTHVKLAKRTINRSYARRDWRQRRPMGKGQRRKVEWHLRCLTYRPAKRKIKRHWKREAKQFAAYRSLRLITPYPGPNGTWWAIPWYIVSCESGGSWSAVNSSSGAFSPYQFLPSTYAAYCVACNRSRYDLHLAAHRLWSASGSSPWVCA